MTIIWMFFFFFGSISIKLPQIKWSDDILYILYPFHLPHVQLVKVHLDGIPQKRDGSGQRGTVEVSLDFNPSESQTWIYICEKSGSTFTVILACCTEHSPAVRGAVSMTSRHVLTPCSVFPSFLLLWLLALHMKIKTWISGGKKNHKGDLNRFSETAMGFNKEQIETFFPLWKDVNCVTNCAFYQCLWSKLRYLNINSNFLSNCLICDCVRKILEEMSQIKFGLQICQHLIIKHLQCT